MLTEGVTIGVDSRRGNPGGPGNPYAQQVAAFRRALVNAVTEEDISAMATALVDKAKAGDIAAFRVLLPYLVGQPSKADGKEDVSRPIVLCFGKEDEGL